MKADVQMLQSELEILKSTVSDLQNRDFPPLISSNNGGPSSTATQRQHDDAVSAASVVREAVKTGALSTVPEGRWRLDPGQVTKSSLL